MTPQELYVELKKAQYDSRPYDRLTGMGDNMEIVEEVIDNYWRERFLLNNTEKTAYELMDRSLHLTFLTEKDVDWESVSTLDNNRNAYSFSAYYQRFAVEKFKEGVALVEWTLYPDGRYFMDTHANVVIPFQAKSWEELEKQRPNAVRIAKKSHSKN